MLKLTTDKHEASRGLSATGELLVFDDATYRSFLKPGTHWRQSRMSKRLSTKINTGNKSATKSTISETFDFVADLSKVKCCRLGRLCQSR